MGLIDLFNQWIVERGSSAVQEKHLALFKDQLVAADKKIVSLNEEIAILKTESETTKAESVILKQENINLKATVSQLTQEAGELRKRMHAPGNPIQHEQIPPAPQINIMKLLFGHDTLPIEQIAHLFNLKLQEAKYHLAELQTLKMVKEHAVHYYEEHKSAAGTMHIPKTRPSWTLEQKGRKFLIDNKLT